ncbi:MAG: DsrE family protein [Hydrogenophaga sp.]|nr:DsrE family protein [Hydrogenophaga sp.]
MKTPSTNPTRRSWLSRLVAVGASAAAVQPVRAATPAASASAIGQSDAPHKIVYQLNKADEDYHEAIFNSISALLKKYVDDVAIAVVVWGPGIHLLAKNPKRPISELHKQRVRSMAESYGIEFIACGNTMHTVGWTAADMLEFARIEEVGAAAVMELQEKGYKYLAW